MPPRPSIIKPCRALTLVELLVVLAVIGLMMALVGPSIGSVMRGQQLQGGSQILKDHLTLARHLAITRNEPVYLFFCRSGREERETVLISSRSDASELLANPLRLPPSVEITDDPDWSPLMTLDEIDCTLHGESLKARRFSFRPSGNTSLPPSEQWYLTLHPRGQEIQPHFATLGINPVTGVISIYQP